jgi:hypothetical protein
MLISVVVELLYRFEKGLIIDENTCANLLEAFAQRPQSLIAM